MSGNSTKVTSLTRLLDEAELQHVVNMGFVLVCGFLCFLLQAGFGLLEVGSVRKKNAKNIMLKNIMDAAVAAIAYWAVGYAFAYGPSNNSFIGNGYYFLMPYDGEDFADYVNFFFQYVFAGTVATIVSGAVAERCRFRAYLLYSFYLSGVVYPIVCHWIWDPNGFMYGRVYDYSGSGAVHLVGGAAAMSAAWILGPRIGRFVKDKETGKWEVVEIPGHDAVLAATGTLLLWFGFFPFNAGAGYSIAGIEALDATGRAVVITLLSGASGSFTMLFYALYKYGSWDPAFAMNGLLGGMVASCSGVNVYDPWIGVVVGILGSLGFLAQMHVNEQWLRIDDPLNASSLHMGSGIVGLLAVGFLANDKYIGGKDKAGVFYGGTGEQLGWQVFAMVVYFLWAFGMSSLLFLPLKCFGVFRVSEEVELMGMDEHHHGGAAYRSEIFTKRESTRPLELSENVGEGAVLDEVEAQSSELQMNMMATRSSEFDGSSQMIRRRRSSLLRPGEF